MRHILLRAYRIGVLLLAVGGVLFASTASAQVPGMSTRLSTATAVHTQNDPTISGTNVVWTDTERLPSGSTNADIYSYDLNTNGPAINLTNTPDDQEFLENIKGNKVVWTHSRAGSPGDIVLYDPPTANLTNIATSSSAVSFQQPAISSQYVAFVRTNIQSDIDAFDYINGVSLRRSVTLDAAVQARPRVDGDFIVYEDYGSGNPNVFGYQISTLGPNFALASSGSVGQFFPDINGHTVVWVEGVWDPTPQPPFRPLGGVVPGTEQMVAYDLFTRTRTQLTTVASNKVQPRISGSRVIWTDDRNGNLDIYLYDLATQQELRLITGPGDHFFADIDGDRVVYTSTERGAEEVFLFTIATPATVSQQVGDLRTAITGLAASVFTNANLQKAFINKINAVVQDINQGLYQDALDKLQNDILAKMDGCATAGAPDSNDWITDCGVQAQVSSSLLQAIDLLRALI